MREIINPTVAAMKSRGTPFKGVLFAGLMLTDSGPQLIEYNARFGDPETQVLMTRLASDIMPALIAAHDGTLDTQKLNWKNEAALTVVMAANGYPGAYDKDTEIGGLAAAGALDNVQVFHAGTRFDGARMLAIGGRVLNVTATGASVGAAQARAYEAVAKIKWPDGFCRSDIGWRAVAREKSSI